MAISKVVYNNKILIDLTVDTVLADKVLKGYTAHGADGELITGTCDFDSNTQDATAADSEILKGKTAVVKGSMKTGTMPNHGGVSAELAEKDDMYIIPRGYHDGSGIVTIPSEEQLKIKPENIREGVTILGVLGVMTGLEDVVAQPKKIVTPSTVVQKVVPEGSYTHLTEVEVLAIPYEETDNSAGGKTVTIASA